ncbi:MAG: glutathione-disulfide reductase [Alphaproteobacteria bacterium]|nr:glutathione-disulfide reductase [Alphaproteobacteria bacterium]
MYDLVVIGGGSGGVRAARMAASYGARVAVVEEYRYGGTCVIRGCVPKKHFVHASRFPELFEVAPAYGWTVSSKFDWDTLRDNKDKEIARLESVYRNLLNNSGVEVLDDRAEVAGPNAVRLIKQGRDIETRFILVATGGTPFRPDIPGALLGITSNEAFDLKVLPASILIEGAGYVAVEFAGIFAGLGVRTTLVYRRDNVLRGFDPDLRKDLHEAMARRGIIFRFETTIDRLDRAERGVRATFHSGDAENFGAVMFATGRKPNTRNMGLEAAGVDMEADGVVKVDAFSRTSVPSIYAVGDVTGRAELTPVAIREGAAFAETVFNANPTAVDHSLVPTAVFSEPEIGTVGMGEEEAAAKIGDIDVWVTRFRPLTNTLGDKPDRIMLKLITEKDAGKVVGVHILGQGAAEMIQLVAIPMAMGATKADFDRAIAVHPTAAEELVTFKVPSYVYRGGVKQ